MERDRVYGAIESLNSFLYPIAMLGGLALMLAMAAVSINAILECLFSVFSRFLPAANKHDLEPDPEVTALKQLLVSRNVFVQHVRSDHVLKHVFEDDRPRASFWKSGWVYEAGPDKSYWIDDYPSSDLLWGKLKWDMNIWPNSEFECVFTAASPGESQPRLLWVHQLGVKLELNSVYRLVIGGSMEIEGYVSEPSFTCTEVSFEKVREMIQRAGYECSS